MSAQLVVMKEAPTDPKDCERRVSEAYFSAWHELENALVAAGHRIETAPAYQHLADPIGRLFTAAWRVSGDFKYVWEGRAKRLQRALNATLAVDSLTQEQRAAIISAMHGTTKVGRDPELFSDTELNLVVQYRRMDTAGRQMVTGHKTEAVYRRYAITCEADLREGVARLNGDSGCRRDESSPHPFDVSSIRIFSRSRLTSRATRQRKGTKPTSSSRLQAISTPTWPRR